MVYNKNRMFSNELCVLFIGQPGQPGTPGLPGIKLSKFFIFI